MLRLWESFFSIMLIVVVFGWAGAFLLAEIESGDHSYLGLFPIPAWLEIIFQIVLFAIVAVRIWKGRHG